MTTSPRARSLSGALALLSSLALLSGCAAPASNGPTTTGPSSGAAASSTTASSSTESETKTVSTAFGDVTMPTRPTRAIALEGGVGPLLSAGITPIATADGDYAEAFLPQEYEQVKDLPVILTPDGWDYEQIAALKPDVLIGFVRAGDTTQISPETKEEFKKLNSIAPTVFILSEGSASTKEATLQISEILGDGERAEQAKQAYLDKAAEIKQKHATVLQDAVFAPVDYYEGTTTVYTPISWLGGILTDIDATITPVAASTTDTNGVDLSSEQLTQLQDATVILHEQTQDGQPGPGAAELAQVPTFAQLPAVQDGHDFGVEHFFADRYETGLQVLEQLDEILGRLG